MNTVKLEGISEVKIAKDNRQFYTAEFSNPSNPFGRTVKRNFWQQKNAAGEAEWRGADPTKVKLFIGKTLPGSIVAKNVEPYVVEIPGQEPRTVTSYTTVILDGELESNIFKSMGHPLAEEATTTVVEEANAVGDIAIN